MLSRRGFLSTLAAASVGLAVYDPDTRLWTPGRAIAPVHASLAEAMSLQAEALRFAKIVADMLQRRAASESLVLREIMYQHTGRVDLPTDALILPRSSTPGGVVQPIQAGRFEHAPMRIIKTVGAGTDIWAAASQMCDDLAGSDTFAPIGLHLRPGEPFADGEFVAIATDPSSGLSIRAIQHEAHRGRWLTTFEINAGTWRAVSSALLLEDVNDYEPEWGVAPGDPRASDSGQTGSYETIDVDAEKVE